METPNINNKIYISENTSEIISGILNKYSLEQSDEELAKKMFPENETEEPFVINGAVILEIAKSLTKKETTEKNAITILQKELGVSQIVATKIVDEIKSLLVSMMLSDKPVFPKEKLDTGLPKKIDASSDISAAPFQKIKTPPITEKIDSTIPQIKQPTGPDNYREPIE